MISSPVLSIQAQKLHNNLHVDNPRDFRAFKAWLRQHSHRITQVEINGKMRSADTNAADEFFPISQIYSRQHPTSEHYSSLSEVTFINMMPLNKAKIR